MPTKQCPTTTKTTTPRGALKLREAAEYLGGLNLETVRRLIDRGLLHPNRSTRHLLFPVVELDRFLAAGQKEKKGGKH